MDVLLATLQLCGRPGDIGVIILSQKHSVSGIAAGSRFNIAMLSWNSHPIHQGGELYSTTAGCLLVFMLADDTRRSLDDGPSGLSESSFSLLRSRTQQRQPVALAVMASSYHWWLPSPPECPRRGAGHEPWKDVELVEFRV